MGESSAETADISAGAESHSTAHNLVTLLQPCNPRIWQPLHRNSKDLGQQRVSHSYQCHLRRTSLNSQPKPLLQYIARPNLCAQHLTSLSHLKIGSQEHTIKRQHLKKGQYLTTSALLGKYISMRLTSQSKPLFASFNPWFSFMPVQKMKIKRKYNSRPNAFRFKSGGMAAIN